MFGGGGGGIGAKAASQSNQRAAHLVFCGGQLCVRARVRLRAAFIVAAIAKLLDCFDDKNDCAAATAASSRCQPILLNFRRRIRHHAAMDR